MSINDLLDDKSFLPILMILFVFVMLVFFIFFAKNKAKIKEMNIFGENDSYKPITKINAKVIEKFDQPFPNTPTVMIKMIIFEADDKSRIQLAVQNPSANGSIVIGDYGCLQFQGKKFISFERFV